MPPKPWFRKRTIEDDTKIAMSRAYDDARDILSKKLQNFSSEDVRATAITLFIERRRNGRKYEK